MCKERLIEAEENDYPFGQKVYKEEVVEDWGANEAYRLHDTEYGPKNKYLLCYDDLIVEIDFDWEPTAQQKAIAGEKLNNR